MEENLKNKCCPRVFELDFWRSHIAKKQRVSRKHLLFKFSVGPYRLTVRTAPSQGVNPGSIPGRVTSYFSFILSHFIFEKVLFSEFFDMIISYGKTTKRSI